MTSRSRINVKSLLFHCVSLVILTQSIRSLSFEGPLAELLDKTFGGRFQFLTVCGLWVAFASFILGAVNDITGIQWTRTLKEAMAIVAVPLGGFISVVYWTLVMISKGLLIPPDPLYQLPLGVDLGLHAWPTILLWIDFLYFSPPFGKRSNPLIASAVATLAYSSWVELCASKNGHFAYPFLDAAIGIRLAIYVSSMFLSVLLFHLANHIHLNLDDARARRRGRSVRGD